MIGYATIGTNDIAKARAFYDALLADLGGKRLFEMGEEDGGLTMYGTDMESPMIAVTRPYDRQPATPGNGNMLGLMLDSRGKVDAAHARALELGGSDEGAPGIRGDESMGFYGAYFRDPEGNKLAVFAMGPAQ